MNRMTDERLAEIESMRMRCVPLVEGADVLPASSELTEELLQALKAEREKVEELEAERDEGYEAGWHKLRNERDDLKARLQRIGELPEKWRKDADDWVGKDDAADELQAELEGSD